MMGAERGSTMLKNNLKLEQPSTLADCSNSVGSVLWKKTRAMTIFQIAAAFGRTIAQTVSINPKYLTTKYVGIKPPSQNIVRTNIAVNKFLPTKSFRPNA